MKIIKEKFNNENGMLQERITQELTMTEYLLMGDVQREKDELILAVSKSLLPEDYVKREFDL